MGWEPNPTGIPCNTDAKLYIEAKSWGIVMESTDGHNIKIDKTQVREIIEVLEMCERYIG